MICLLSQFGLDEVELVSEVRNRAGRKDAPSMVAEEFDVEDLQRNLMTGDCKRCDIRSAWPLD